MYTSTLYMAFLFRRNLMDSLIILLWPIILGSSKELVMIFMHSGLMIIPDRSLGIGGTCCSI